MSYTKKEVLDLCDMLGVEPNEKLIKEFYEDLKEIEIGEEKLIVKIANDFYESKIKNEEVE